MLVPALAACKVELYSNLSEQEANTVIAVLLNHGIDAEKAAGKDRTASVRVEKTDLARAVEILNQNGLPREKAASLGEIFKKQGLISSPVEERARLIYALSQELSGTLSRIDGVVWARVHVVLSEGDGDAANSTPSSAAVLIKYANGYDLPSLVPQVKRLVSNSIAGLRYDNVSVVLVSPQAVSTEGESVTQADAPSSPAAKTADLTSGGRGVVRTLGMILVAIFAVTLAVGCWRYRATIRAKLSARYGS